MNQVNKIITSLILKLENRHTLLNIGPKMRGQIKFKFFMQLSNKFVGDINFYVCRRLR